MLGIDIRGFSAGDERLLRLWCERALEYMDASDESLTIRPRSSLGFAVPQPQADNSGVQFPNQLFKSNLLTGKRAPDWYIAFLLYEEVAHVLLGRAGVPHGGELGVFFQEVYATWVQYSGIVATKIAPPGKMRFTPVPKGARGEELYYSLGKQLGATVGGSVANRHYLEEWMRRSGRDERAASIVRDVEGRLAVPVTREAVVELYGLHAKHS